MGFTVDVSCSLDATGVFGLLKVLNGLLYCSWYYPGVNGSGQLNHDWFSHARQRGTSMLWTEDWFGDGLSCKLTIHAVWWSPFSFSFAF